MLFKVLERMIARGQTDDLMEKIDVFYAAGRITTEQYEQLSNMLNDVM